MLREITMVFLMCSPVLLSTPAIAATYGKDSKVSFRNKIVKDSAQDHSEFEELKEEMDRGPDVTSACLGCHQEKGEEILQSHHWTWRCPTSRSYDHGKSGFTINNSTISPVPNEFSCYHCHISYRWEDHSLPLDSPDNIDCLICHEQTNGLYDQYRKEWHPQLNEVAQNVGRPTKRNCGVCHFNRGGGDGLLRGELSSKLLEAGREHDVHMAKNGANLECIDCHITSNHTISGRCYENRATVSTSQNGELLDCVNCHNQKLHVSLPKMDDHTDRVACQTCHIPSTSRGKYSRIWKDYSKAGRKKEGKTILIKDENGNKKYSTNSGELKWAKNIQPDYFWYKGKFRYTLVTDNIDPAGTVTLNDTDADYHTPQSKIYPFKVHRAKQPYDKMNNTMVLPKFMDHNKDSGAYWMDHDWSKAIQAGMNEAGLLFSGEYGFVETEYLYPIHHMVVPKEKALRCTECHTRSNGRLENLKDYYMPGRDRSLIIDYGGSSCVLLALVSVFAHAGIRISKLNRIRR